MPKEEKKDYIAPIKPEDLARAINDPDEETSFKEILEDEKEYIKAWREYRDNKPQPDEINEDSFIGLGLSGNGIRSATFCLGVMQALADFKGNLFNKVDYLSTVSGGGYIGSSINWLMNQFPIGKEGNVKFPYGSGQESEMDSDRSNKKQAQNLRYLREHGNYLTPGHGISAASAVAVFLRGLLLNLSVWIPFFLFWMLLIVITSKGIADSDWYQKFISNQICTLEKKNSTNDETSCLKSVFCKNTSDKQSLLSICKVIKYHPVSFLFLLGSVFLILRNL